MMKRIVALLFFLSLLLFAALLIAPGFVDWNQHKEQILKQLSPYVQRKIDVAGDISFKILPEPELILGAVTISNIPDTANAADTKTPVFLTLKQLALRVKLEPLLEGRIEVETIRLVEPILNLEIAKDGTENWSGLLKENPVSAVSEAIQLNQVIVTKGTLHYLNRISGTDKNFEDVNLSVTAPTLWGPYHMTGDMKFLNATVNLDISTEPYEKGAPVPLHIALLPAKSGALPQIKFNGVMDLHSGMDMQGELSLSQGKLDHLLKIDSLNTLSIMHKVMDMHGTLEWKKDQFLLNDIKAKIAPEGVLQGKMSLQFSHDGNPSIALDMEGSALSLTDRPDDVYASVPKDFSGTLHFKGKNIVWGEYKVAAIDIAASVNQKEWVIKAADLVLPGNGQVKLAGIFTPKTDSASFTTVQLTTDDLTKFIAYFSPADNSIFKLLADADLIKKISLSTGLEISPAKISFFNLDATAEEKEKLFGVFDVDRLSPQPNFTAKLNFSDWDTAALPAGAYDRFLQNVMKSTADMEITARNHTIGGLKIPDISFKGKIDGQELLVENLMETLSDKESFTLKGRIGSFSPLTGMDMTYALKAEDANSMVKILEPFRLPTRYLFVNKGPLESTGTLTGTPDQYKIDKMQTQIGTCVISGSVEKKNDIYSADLHFNKFDLDQWTTAGETGGASTISIALQSDDLLWQGQHVSKADLMIETSPVAIKIAPLKGTLWGGRLNADITFTKPEMKTEGVAAAWASHAAGTLKQADLNLLQNQLGLKGFTTGVGDIDFDLASPENTLGTASGKVSIHTSALTLQHFNFDKLSDTVSAFTELPKNLQQQIDGVFRKNGPTIFKDVQGQFTITPNQLTIKDLKLANSYGDITATGSINALTGIYTASGDLHLKQPELFPVLTMHATSEMPDYTVDVHALENFIIKNTPPPVVVQPDVAPIPPPAATVPAEEGGGSAIKNILKHLDENDDTAEEPSDEKEGLPPPAPQIPATPPPDTERAPHASSEEMVPKAEEGVPLP